MALAASTRLEVGNKLTAEDTTEHLDGKKERAARGDPAGVVWSESAGSKHAVDMGMMLQTLIPGMEHAEEADLRAKVPGIASDLKQGLRAAGFAAGIFLFASQSQHGIRIRSASGR